MNLAQMTLIEQMRITQMDMDARKSLLNFDENDVRALLICKPLIEAQIENIVEKFYANQISVPEIASLIGDADTLSRLQSVQRQYILDLFAGNYGMEYINNRLRIGLVHKRIGVEPKLYLAAVHQLRTLLVNTINTQKLEKIEACEVISALDKLIFYDVTLVFETYIQSMVSEIKMAKDKSEEYARALEKTVVKRTGELRTDSLTGLISRRFLDKILLRSLREAKIRSEPISIVFIDINGFKAINDTKGHVYGDDILKNIGRILLKTARRDDACIRYGGDEFCIVLSNITEMEAKNLYCRRVNTLLAEEFDDVTVSMGVLQTGPDDYDDVETLLRRADERMYKHKTALKNNDVQEHNIEAHSGD